MVLNVHAYDRPGHRIASSRSLVDMLQGRGSNIVLVSRAADLPGNRAAFVVASTEGDKDGQPRPPTPAHAHLLRFGPDSSGTRSRPSCRWSAGFLAPCAPLSEASIHLDRLPLPRRLNDRETHRPTTLLPRTCPSYAEVVRRHRLLHARFQAVRPTLRNAPEHRCDCCRSATASRLQEDGNGKDL